MNFGERMRQEVEAEQAKGIHSNFNACMFKSECCDKQSEIERLRAALSAVKSWDIGNALGVLSVSGEAKFALPENIRKQVQDALA
jgi:hypothetical protein